MSMTKVMGPFKLPQALSWPYRPRDDVPAGPPLIGLGTMSHVLIIDLKSRSVMYSDKLFVCQTRCGMYILLFLKRLHSDQYKQSNSYAIYCLIEGNIIPLDVKD